MKKIIVMLALAMSTHMVSAQTNTSVNPLVTEFIETQGVKKQMLSAKESLDEYILAENKDTFSKEFDKLVDKFIGKFGKVVSKNLSDDDVKGLTKALKDQVPYEGLSEDKKTKFEEELMVLQTEIGMELNELIMEYGNPELFQE